MAFENIRRYVHRVGCTKINDNFERFNKKKMFGFGSQFESNNMFNFDN